MAVPAIENEREDKIVDRLKREGQLTRNSGTNSLKVIIKTLDNIFNLLVVQFDTTAREAAINKFKLEEKLAEEQRKKDEAKGKGFGFNVDTLKGAGGLVKKGIGGVFGAILKVIQLLTGPAILFFLSKLPEILDSKIFKDSLAFIQDTLIPLGKEFYEGVLVPFGAAVKEFFTKSLYDAFQFFENLKETFRKFREEGFLSGATDLVKNIGEFLGKLADNFGTAIYNLFAELFDFEKTDSIFGVIKEAFISVKDKVVGFFKDVMKSISSTIESLKLGFVSNIPTETARGAIGELLGVDSTKVEAMVRKEDAEDDILAAQRRMAGSERDLAYQMKVGQGDTVFAQRLRERIEEERRKIEELKGEVQKQQAIITPITDASSRVTQNINNNITKSTIENKNTDPELVVVQ
tara:strand:+ start:47 stop:1264 length:1218 start_codon:yes stop_codon:yes gene_type:complete